MKKVVLIMAILALTMLAFVGCAQDTPDTSANNEEVLLIDKDKKEIKMLTEVNGKYFTEPTRHGVVFKDGSNGEKSVLRGLADQTKFYDALISLGAEPGNNVDFDAMTKGGVKVEGSKLDVFVTWEGLDKEIPFNDIIKSSDPRPMDIRFGGNIDRSKDKNTGCVLCLDSCAVGITSNSSYGTGESETVKFYGNDEVLPEDGTQVVVIFRLAE